MDKGISQPSYQGDVPPGINSNNLLWLWEYQNVDGTVAGYVARYSTSDGKAIPYFTQKDKRWIKRAPEYPRPLFGITSLPDEEKVTVYVCEGEKSAQAMLNLGLPCITSQGGANAAGRSDWTPLERYLSVVIVPDNDEPGNRYAQDVARALQQLPGERRIQIACLPGLPPKGDVVDWLQKREPNYDGYGHLPPESVSALRQELFAEIEEVAVEPVLKVAAQDVRRMTYQEMAKGVNAVLDNRPDRERKRLVASDICEWYLKRGKLLLDVSVAHQPTPYLVLEDGQAVAIHADNNAIVCELNRLGQNPVEQMYRRVVEELKACAVRSGRAVRLSRFATSRNGGSYLSCGPTKLVKAEMIKGKVRLQVCGNGFDEVLFASDACLPSWSIAEPVDPVTLPVFRDACLEAPDEVPDYTPDAQRDLLRGFMASIVAGLTQKPVLALLGGAGSGKSTVARAVVQAIHGPEGALASIPNSARDFEVCASGLAVYAIDNLDGRIDDELTDKLAASATGASLYQRALYTDFQLTTRPVVAAMLVTSRTGEFASRPDVLDRCVPIQFGNQPGSYIEESKLLEPVVQHRDGILTFLAEQACRGLNEVQHVSSGGRFVDFSKMVAAGVADRSTAENHLRALGKAQRLSVAESDEVVEAIYSYHVDGWDKERLLSGTPKELLARLESSSTPLMSYQGGGKAFGRALREAKPTLQHLGIRMAERKCGTRTIFEFNRMPQFAPHFGDPRRN